MPADENPKVEQAIESIKKRYELGKQILKECGMIARPRMMKELAAKANINPDTAQKLRALANEEIGFTGEDLEALFLKFRKEERALTISHLIRLVSIKKGPERDAMIDLAIRQKWSSHQLQREITSSKSEPNLRNAGRKPVIRTGQNFELELARTLWSWRRVLNLQMKQNQEIEAELMRNLKSLGKKIDQVMDLLKRVEKKHAEVN